MMIFFFATHIQMASCVPFATHIQNLLTIYSPLATLSTRTERA
ncbi:hypothetical protein Lalb_Chr24g0398331 [Lupinus albus]|uniref:Uncharacterized protein n=1 Tax=Lupinus albus TaxID=3870 RepID=A0A6A4N7Q0_LUPAL|nr:hypothetical protein Lalb_Chr24g0398331 [Lupinus albus]